MPLVIFLHGGGGNAQGASQNYQLSAKADREGFIVLYPNGTGLLSDRGLTWNAGHCCGYRLGAELSDILAGIAPVAGSTR